MEAPPGGPADTKRPYVSAVSPAPDSVRVGRELKAQIAFSEWVAPDAAKGKVYLNPPLTKRIRSELSGNVLEVTSKGRLDTNTTYVLGILGSIQDLNGQSLESPMQLAFSTGPGLDSGRLTGKVGAFQGKAAAGAFAALYPRGPELRARFQHLTHRNDSVVTPSVQPEPLKERPAYIAPSDSQGRFDFKRLRPGRYGLIGFQDINGDLVPNVGSEALGIGPSVDIAAAPGDMQSLALFPYDTIPVRLAEARWAGESLKGNQSSGTIRLKFNRPPHPTQALRRDFYQVRRLGPKGSPDAGEPVPLQDICLNPTTGEVELQTPPLDADSQYVASCPGLRDIYGNPIDTARDQAGFRVGRGLDTAKPAMTFLGPRRISGEAPRLPSEGVQPNRGITVHYTRLLSDSTLAWLRGNLVVKLDTLPVAWNLARLSHHEFALNLPPNIPLKGQRLAIGLKPDTTALKAQAAPPARATPQTLPQPPQSPPPSPAAALPPVPPVSVAAFILADTAKMGSLRFWQAPSAFGSRLVIRAVASPLEFSRVTPAKEEFVVDSLPQGFYAVDYFRDTNGDAVWHPGSLAPWAVQEPYVQWADSVEVKAREVSRGDGARGLKTPPEEPLTGIPAPSGAPAGTVVPGVATPGEAAAPSIERKLSWPPVP
jgi:Big-like domain-containing protein